MLKVQGIYGILPQDVALDALLRMAQAALDGGIRFLQLRDKQLESNVVDRRLQALSQLVNQYQATLILNDRVSDLAVGVHMGRDDFHDLQRLRQQCSTRLLGVTCKGDLAFASQAIAAGVDYISFGAMYPTSSKKDAKPIAISTLKEARACFKHANIVAIGGIRQQHFPELRAAGADAVAMIQTLFAVDDIKKRAKELVFAWEHSL